MIADVVGNLRADGPLCPWHLQEKRPGRQWHCKLAQGGSAFFMAAAVVLEVVIAEYAYR